MKFGLLLGLVEIDPGRCGPGGSFVRNPYQARGRPWLAICKCGETGSVLTSSVGVADEWGLQSHRSGRGRAPGSSGRRCRGLPPSSVAGALARHCTLRGPVITPFKGTLSSSGALPLCAPSCPVLVPNFDVLGERRGGCAGTRRACEWWSPAGPCRWGKHEPIRGFPVCRWESPCRYPRSTLASCEVA